MKILCPIDFSQASVNAVKWIVQFLDYLGEGEVHLLHTVNAQRRSGLFVPLDEMFMEKANVAVAQLIESMRKISDKVKFSSEVVVADPKRYIVALSKRKIYDWIVTGTKGLTALKNITVGSVTEYIIEHSDNIILAIPEEASFDEFKVMVLGVDDQILDDGQILDPVKNLCNLFDARLYMVHVRRKDDSVFEYDPALDIYLEDVNYEYKALEYENSVAETITEYCEYVKADMLIMIHRKKNWLERLFVRSITKSELFEIKTPLLILHSD
ncbi:MAG: universal stress protein [Bacteroidia bacterium]|nr:universal stress protein [Bacteroidia bacterium]